MNNNDSIEKPYSPLVITKKTKENIKKYQRLYIGSPLRVQLGKIYTNEEFKKRSDEVLNKELPGGSLKLQLKQKMKK